MHIEAATGETDPVAGRSGGGDPFIDGIVREQLGAWIQFGSMGHAGRKTTIAVSAQRASMRAARRITM